MSSILPTTEKQLQPNKSRGCYKEHAKQKKHIQKQHYNKGSKPRPILNVGDSCRVQMGKIWKQAVVLKTHGERSFLIKTEDGAILRRNSRFLQ